MGRLVERRPELEPIHLLYELGAKLIEDALLYEDALRADARLTRGDKGRKGDTIDRLIDVRTIVKHNDRRVAAQLRAIMLHLCAGQRTNRLARRRAARKINLDDVIVLTESPASDRA